MSEFLAAATEALGTPEALVSRSASARASAAGISVDDVLKAWAGGGAVAATSAPAPSASAEEAEAPAEPMAPSADAPSPAAPTSSTQAPGPIAEPAAVAVAVAAEPEPEPVIAASLSERLSAVTRMGSIVGLVLGVLGWVFGAQYLLVTASAATESESFVPTVEVMSGSFVLGAMLISVVIGLTVAGLARLVPGWMSPGMRFSGSALPTAALGVLGGGLIGALVGAIVVGSGTELEIPEGVTSVPVVSGVLWTALVWLGGGWLLAALTQALGVPEGVEPEEADEVVTVRARIVSAFGIPLVAAIAILALVLPFAYVFISFPSWAPLTGSIISGSILAFAFLSASRPNMRVGVSELLVGALGIGVVIVLIASVLSAFAPDEHGEEEGDGHAEEEAAAEEAEAFGGWVIVL